jgi:adenylate kinase family enzyme
MTTFKLPSETLILEMSANINIIRYSAKTHKYILVGGSKKKFMLGDRIMIIGCCGCGKTTLANALHKILKLPVVHLDKLYWKPGWIESTKEEWIEKQNMIVMDDEWIIDGNYAGSLDIRLNRCTSVIFLDYSRWICTYRIFKRFLRHIGKTREDMAEGCQERIGFRFLKFVWNFPKHSRYKNYQKMIKYDDVVKLVLKNPRETRKFVNEINLFYSH